MKKIGIIFLIISLFETINAFAFVKPNPAPTEGINLTKKEPTYCNPNKFSTFEISPPSISGKIIRLHLFRLGKVVLGGMGIGKSQTTAMMALAKNYSPQVDQTRYCTWFVGSNNSSAQEAFNFRPIPDLFSLNINNAAPTFMKILDTSFTQDSINFLSCAENDHYIAVGCNQQQHRGPTVFGMILAFSGCTAEHATAITNNIWGLNGIAQEVRLSIIKAAYDLGNANPIDRAALAQQFSN